MNWAMAGLSAMCILAAAYGGAKGKEGMGFGFGFLAALMAVLACMPSLNP